MKRFMLIVECPKGASYQDVRDVLKETILQVGSAAYSRSGYPADGDGAHISTANVRGYWVVDSSLRHTCQTLEPNACVPYSDGPCDACAKEKAGKRR